MPRFVCRLNNSCFRFRDVNKGFRLALQILVSLKLLFCQAFKFDTFVKSLDFLFFSIPAKAGIQSFQLVSSAEGFHEGDWIRLATDK